MDACAWVSAQHTRMRVDMRGSLPNLLRRFQPSRYGRKPSLVLINGLAEQSESWYRNHRYWRRYFDLYMPNYLVYDGEAIHHRIKAKQPISIDYLVDQLHQYLTKFQACPITGGQQPWGKITVEFAVKYPELGNDLLLCPSGMGERAVATGECAATI